MRLWHKDLIKVLPRQQLLGQWRELCAMVSDIESKGKVNHILINYVNEIDLSHLYWFINEVLQEMTNRGYRTHAEPDQKLLKYTGGVRFMTLDDVYPEQHDERYFLQCYYNLQEKYDRGGVAEDEWELIENKYRGGLRDE